MILRGTFVHTPHLKSLEILHDHLLVVNSDGFIAYLAPAHLPESRQILETHVGPPVIEVPTGSFIMPAFCDLHLHAPQFLYQGTGLDLPLMQWLDRYALKAEARMDADAVLAKRVYTRLAARLRENGTGTVLLFGTIKEETNLILAECMRAAGLRAFTYVEPSAAAALSNAHAFVDHCHALVAHLPPSQRLVAPVLTPRFVPTCTDELLAGLGALSETLGVKIQSHLAEAKDQVEWVRALRGMEDIDVFDKNNLLTPRTVQAHCTFLGAPDFARVAARGTAIAHCPLSNAYFSAAPFALREALDRGVTVGLGTDVAGGYSLDVMNAMRQAVATARMREGRRQMGAGAGAGGSESGLDLEAGAGDRSIDWTEALFLATRGGALALGLEGTFSVGAPFDAQEIRLFDSHTGVGVGPLDYFDLESDVSGSGDQASATKDTPIGLEHVEKWWCVGDTRNRGAVWVQGNEIRSLVV
ncbi:hypothetical protein BJ912DRAFT_977867 [Pholiota molesta]|nr:hypothetical protein BJ912DRAFT_977867 [Pholiota molesta]